MGKIEKRKKSESEKLRKEVINVKTKTLEKKT